MSKYDGLAYLFSDAHRNECLDFANFLAGGFAEYLGCSRDKICFVSDKHPESISSECAGLFADYRNGFVHTMIGIILPNERMRGSAVRVAINIRKVRSGFLVWTDRSRETYTLRKEDRENLHEFYESLFHFNLLTDP